MKKIIYIFLAMSFLFLDSHASAPTNIIQFKWNEAEEDADCYWMENYSGKFEWVATENALGRKYNKQECFSADSCDGGLGGSGGGCYKWAKTADGPRFEWGDKIEEGS